MAADPYINHTVIAENSGWDLKLHMFVEKHEVMFRYSIEGFAGPGKGVIFESPLHFCSYERALKHGMTKIRREDQVIT